MPKIVWKGIIKDEKDFPASVVPKNAIKIDSEEDMKKIQLKALPFMIPLIFVCLLCMFVKTLAANERIVNFWFVFIGVVIGFMLIIVHELLHAIAFPKDATVFIGIIPKSFVAVAVSSSPVKRNRFIFLSILPIILGIIPLVTFCLGNNDAKELNGVMFGMAVMGMVSVYPDLYHSFHLFREVPRTATIQNNKSETYYFESR